MELAAGPARVLTSRTTLVPPSRRRVRIRPTHPSGQAHHGRLNAIAMLDSVEKVKIAQRLIEQNDVKDVMTILRSLLNTRFIATPRTRPRAVGMSNPGTGGRPGPCRLAQRGGGAVR